jgi:TetR/AcrR family transcriptional repressor of nem operon
MPRHKEYERDEVLDRALEVFWEKGYEATTVQDLVEGMGINRFSLYDSFGSKRELFFLALDRYVEVRLSPAFHVLEEAEEPLAGVRRFVRGYVDLLVNSNHRGCLLANSAVEVRVVGDDVAGHTCLALVAIEHAVQGALERARDQGVLRQGVDPALAAPTVWASLMGLSSLCRAGMGPDRLERSAEVLIGLLKESLEPRIP